MHKSSYRLSTGESTAVPFELGGVDNIPGFVLNELYTRDTSRDALSHGNGHFRKAMLSLETPSLNEGSSSHANRACYG